MKLLKDFFHQEVVDLDSFRKRMLILSCCIVIIICMFFLVYRLFNQQYVIVLFDLATILITIIIIYVTNDKKMNDPILLLMYTIFSSLLTYMVYQGNYHLLGGAIFLVLTPMTTLFYFKKLSYKLVFCLLISIYLFIIGYQFNEITYLELFIPFLLFLGIFYLLSELLNRFERDIKKGTIKREKLISQLQYKNDEVKLYNDIMAHDIKAPLRNIKGFNDVIQMKLIDEIEKDATIKEYFDFVDSGISSLENLIGHLLQKSQIEASLIEVEDIDLKVLIEKLLDKFRYRINEQNIDISSENLKTIQGDKEQISIVLSNLISNSIKYQPKNENHTPKLRIVFEENEKNNIISIEDNGVGIEAENLKNIFEPFKRLYSTYEYEGTGLGLNICKMIVEKHKGELLVESTVGVGSLFKIVLPKKYLETEN